MQRKNFWDVRKVSAKLSNRCYKFVPDCEIQWSIATPWPSEEHEWSYLFDSFGTIPSKFLDPQLLITQIEVREHLIMRKGKIWPSWRSISFGIFCGWKIYSPPMCDVPVNIISTQWPCHLCKKVYFYKENAQLELLSCKITKNNEELRVAEKSKDTAKIFN